MSEGSLWLVIVGMGAITYGMRSGSLLLAERLPRWAWLSSFLRFVPIAVLSAIVALETAFPNGALDLSPVSNHRLLAAALSIMVAWRTKRMLPTILVGMAALWVLQALS